MMSKLDQIIENLAADVKPVKPTPRPWESFVSWAVVTAAATFLLFLLSAPRPDLNMQIHSPLYMAELITIALLILSAAFVAVWLSFPDLRQKPWVIYLPTPFLAIYIALMIYRALHPELTTVLDEDAHNDMACVLCITMYSLVPGLWMFFILRRHATTRPRLAGAISLLTAASIGLLVLKIVEGNDSVLHLVEWHLIPVALFGIIGAFLGRKFLSW